VPDPQIRLAEVTAALAHGIDLAFGQQQEHVARTCLLALRIGRRLDLDPATTSRLYWVAQLRFVGCTGHAHEVSAWAGDEISARAASLTLDQGSPQAVFRWVVEHAGAGLGPVQRVARVGRFVAGGRRAAAENFRAGCQVGRMLTERLGLPEEVGRALDFAFERFDGKGFPDGVAGEAIPLTMRIVHAATEAEIFGREGPDLVSAMAAQRAGHLLDPRVADVLVREADELLTGLDGPSAWQSLLDAEPVPHAPVPAARLDAVLEVLADFADLKSPYTPGHSRGVADLCRAAGPRLGLSEEQLTRVCRAALIHDLGRSCVPNSIWDKPGPLTDAEWERVRLHPYHGERALARSALADLGRLASQHHESPAGDGYHRGLTATQLDPGARLLAAADTYQALTQPRAWRPARTPTEAATVVRERMALRRIDPDAGEAVLAAAGHDPAPPRRRPTNPAGLTDREVEVLRLLARGLTNKQIAGALVISAKTVGHHIERAYTKTGISTRGAAALWCTQHRLL
jgi:HD-GYP domain-containing protein (c-di-GMP phosphodiesterase class II)